jgi:hypothetical protein
MVENIFSASTLLAIAILLLYFFKLKKNSKKQKGKDSAYVGIWWFCIFISGFVLYLVAFLQTPKTETQSTASYYLYSITISLETSIRMFIYNFNYESVKKIADNNIIYCIAIIACFISASIWTTIMAKDIFFKGIINEVNVWLYAHLPLKKNKYHYIIVGCEDSMKLFLSDLQKTVKRRNITIITGIPFKNSNNSNDYFKEFIEDGYTVINGKADEAALIRAGIGNTKRNTKVVAITESDEQNLSVADIITQKIVSIAKKYTDSISQQEIINNINLEAYIMYSFIERTEHFTFAENAYGKVDFFNPYELRARAFFGEHPVTGFIPNLIDTNKARLKGKFKDGKIYKVNGKEYIIKHIFIGFGHTNYQMLKGSILTSQLLGCDYNAIIYDENKPSIRQAMFMNHSSGLFNKGETLEGMEYFKSPEEKYNINFKYGNVLSKDFYFENDDCLIKEIKNKDTINDFTVIYIALGEDKLSIETACEIRQCLYEHGIEQDKIRIFVKVSEESVFNRDSVINNDKNIPIKIECFGLNNSIFTKDNIINESLDKFAKTVTNKNHETPWEFLTETQRDMNRQLAMAIKVKLNLIGFDLADKDEIKNIFDDDIYYNSYLSGGNEKISEIIRLSKIIANCKNEIECLAEKGERFGYILDYVKTDNDMIDGVISDTTRNNLARLEHSRWNTFHLIHGWTKKPINTIGADNSGRKNILAKQHACITTFEELIALRELQAEKSKEKDPNIQMEKALAKADTIWFDYNLMDELIVRLVASSKVITKIKL